MKREITAEYVHEIIKESLFKNTDLSQIAQQSEDERRAFNLEQLEHILSLRPGADALAWLLDQFLNYRGEPRDDNPLYVEDSPLVTWYMELLSIGNPLYHHRPFCLDDIIAGVSHNPEEPKKDFTLENKQLVDWLKQSAYRRVAGMIAWVMLEVEFTRVVGFNEAMQDYYAEHCRSDLFDSQDVKACEKFIDSVLKALRLMGDHEQRGRALGLSDEERRVTDSLWGWAPHDYQENYVAAAREMVRTVDEELPSETIIRSRKGFNLWKQGLFPKLAKISDRHELGINMDDDYNITIGYLSMWLLDKYLGGRDADEVFV